MGRPAWLGGKKEEPPETLEATLSDLGVNINTDRFFRDRLENINKELTGFMTEEEINAMGLSKTRTHLMKLCMRRLRYAWGNVPFGKSKDDQRYAKGMTAARKLLLRAQRAITSDADEHQIMSYCHSVFARIDMLVGYTFDSQNVSINKSVVVQTMQKQDKRYGGEEEEV